MRQHTSPQGFVFLRAPSWSTFIRKVSCFFVPLRGKKHRRKASRPLVAQRALRVTKSHSAWSSRLLASLRGQNLPNPLRRKASCFFVPLRGKKHHCKASRSFVAQRALRATKSHSAWSSRPLASLRGQNLPNPPRRKASCHLVPLSGKTNSTARQELP